MVSAHDINSIRSEEYRSFTKLAARKGSKKKKKKKNHINKIDESRPEPLYFIGIHYYLEHNYNKAYIYFKKAFEIGFPIHCQYSLKPTLSFHFLPKFVIFVTSCIVL